MKVLASKPGIAPPRIDKRTGDSVVCEIDCKQILSDKELIYGKPQNSTTDINVSEARTVAGNVVQFRVSGGPTKVPYTDYSIIFTVNTTFKNVLTVPIIIRAYSN